MSYLCRVHRNNLIEKHAALSILPSKAPPNPLENMTKIAASAAPAEKIEAPMCVNIVRLQDYLLPPDEVVLFDWLLVKQCYVFHHKSFYYSQRRVEKETRIGRRRFETIVQKFKEQGWLWSEVAPSGTRRSAVRRYLVFYDAIARILPKLVRYDTGTYALYKSYLAKMFQMSKAVGAKSTDRLPADVEMEVIALKDRLQAVYESRVKQHNDAVAVGLLLGNKRVVDKLPFREGLQSYLRKLIEKYPTDTIEHAFVAYCDQVLGGQLRPESFMGYFLHYNAVTDEFPIFNTCLDAYVTTYSYGKPKNS
jgi:hypothetical protein